MRTMSEEDFIQKLAGLFPGSRDVTVGIGDDAAALDLGLPGGMLLLAAADQVISRIHFTADTSPVLAAEKLFKRNLSDIAAMGGVPTHALVTVAMNPFEEKALTEFHQGLSNISNLYGVPVIGGDLSSLPEPGLTASLTIFGKAEKEKLCLRCNAAPGDCIYVTGSFGNSFRSGRHLSFPPRLHEARFVAGTYTSAMIDVSDGLAKDIARMAEASGLSARLEPDAVPRSPGASLEQALCDGEDYELVFAVSPSQAEELEKLWPFPGVRLTRIGEFLPGPAGEIRGVSLPADKGYDHFHGKND